MYTTTQNKLTTLSVHKKIIAKLNELSERRGISTNQLIVYCLKRYSREVEVRLNLQRLCQYQPRCKLYKSYPVKIPHSLYEHGLDLRKSLKLSLSFIFAIAFMAYLNDLSARQKSTGEQEFDYSYKESSYSGDCFIENGRYVFIYKWEKPPG